MISIKKNSLAFSKFFQRFKPSNEQLLQSCHTHIKDTNLNGPQKRLIFQYIFKNKRQRLNLENEKVFQSMIELEQTISHSNLLEQVLDYFIFFRELGTPPQAFMKKKFGFCLQRRISSVAGQGIFVDGTVPKGKVIAFYPGTIYFPGDPLLIPSLFNNYLLMRPDQIAIDGNVKGIGPFLYLSCASRETLHSSYDPSPEDLKNYKYNQVVDISWLKAKNESEMNNPLAQGNYANHSDAPNICYMAFDFPSTFPPPLQSYIPNVFLRHRTYRVKDEPYMNSAVLVTLREVSNEEIFGHYCFIGKSTLL